MHDNVDVQTSVSQECRFESGFQAYLDLMISHEKVEGREISIL